MQVDKENQKIIYLDGEEFDKLKEKLLKGGNGEEAYEISKNITKMFQLAQSNKESSLARLSRRFRKLLGLPPK